MVLLLGPFHLIVGIVLTTAALNNQLTPERHPTFPADISFCFLTSLLILTPLVVTYLNRNRHCPIEKSVGSKRS